MIFVDTNYFLRFLLEKKDEQQKQAIELFKKASLGQIKLFTSTIVIFEIYWVLSTFYEKNKKEVKEILIDIFKMDFVQIKERSILLQAIDLLGEFNYDLEDSYNIVFALDKKAEEFMTFDSTLERRFKERKRSQITSEARNNSSN